MNQIWMIFHQTTLHKPNTLASLTYVAPFDICKKQLTAPLLPVDHACCPVSIFHVMYYSLTKSTKYAILYPFESVRTNYAQEILFGRNIRKKYIISRIVQSQGLWRSQTLHRKTHRSANKPGFKGWTAWLLTIEPETRYPLLTGVAKGDRLPGPTPVNW